MSAEGGRRRWVVQLAERQRGDVRLTVQFTRRYDKPEPKGLSLPLLKAEGVEHQSVLVGVEVLGRGIEQNSTPPNVAG